MHVVHKDMQCNSRLVSVLNEKNCTSLALKDNYTKLYIYINKEQKEKHIERAKNYTAQISIC